MMISGTSPDNALVEAIEYSDHPFYVGVQYHPEFKSRPNHPHPLFTGLINASLDSKTINKKEEEEAISVFENALS